MKVLLNPYDTCFLNRTAWKLQADPAAGIQPLRQLANLFRSPAGQELKDYFNRICRAAMYEEFRWEGNPGNCLFYLDRLELLLECCYLIHTAPGSALRQYLQPAAARMPLSATRDPFTVLKSFFDQASLGQWKQQLLRWTENALSGTSITTEEEPEKILPFVELMRQLIATASVISQQYVRSGAATPNF
ncbi:hypothetical protein GCM10027051_21020 [Niabella terrae]